MSSTATRTGSRSMWADRPLMRSSRDCASCDSLFGDGRLRDAIAGARFSQQHHQHFDDVPRRNDQRHVADERAQPAAAVAGGGDQAKAEELLADGAASETVAEEH